MQKTYIIAEAGVNHNGSFDLAIQLIDAAVAAGADAVKFQSFIPDEMVHKSAPKAKYQLDETQTSQYELLQQLQLSRQQQLELYEYCKTKNIDFLSTPFDFVSLDLLCDELKLSKIKISSGDLTNLPFLLKIAQKGVDVILSTGMANLDEIEYALSCLAFGYFHNQEKDACLEHFKVIYSTKQARELLQEKVTLLHCVSEYPTPVEHVNLYAMDILKNKFMLNVGFSDHTLGNAVPLAAVARGAKVIEKHFTLDQSLPGPDHKVSATVAQFTELVQQIRNIELALGEQKKQPSKVEQENATCARKSLVAKVSIKQGDLFSEDNITFKRPGSGVAPIYFWEYLGKPATMDYEAGEIIQCNRLF